MLVELFYSHYPVLVLPYRRDSHKYQHQTLVFIQAGLNHVDESKQDSSTYSSSDSMNVDFCKGLEEMLSSISRFGHLRSWMDGWTDGWILMCMIGVTDNDRERHTR